MTLGRRTESRVLAAAVLASAMAFIDATALNVALPALQQALGASGAALMWIVNAYALVVAALLLVGGALGDRHGRRRTLAAGIFLFTAASLACGLAPDTGLLITARAIQGAGAALMIPGSLALLAATFEAERRGRAIGTWSAWTVIATALGPVMGGLLAHAGWWRGIFFLNVPLAITALALLRQVPESLDPKAPSRLDFAGAVLAIAGLAALNIACLSAPDRAFADPAVLILLAGSFAILAIFGVVEARSAQPLLPLPLLRSRTMVRAVILTLFVYSAFHGLLLFLPLHLVQVQGYDAALAGLAQLPVMLMLVALSRWAGSLLDRQGPRLPLTLGPGVAAAGFLWLSRTGLTAGPAEFWITFLPPLVAIGTGMALTMAPLSATILAELPAEKSGLASGINSTVARLAGVLAVALLGAVALVTFGRALERRAETLDLTPAAKTALLAQSSKFGAAEPPSMLAEPKWRDAQRVIRGALTDTFERICLGAALLCVAGTLAGFALPTAGLTGGRPAARNPDVSAPPDVPR
jgi:EmrB/QacA subfamily drug resistance transporter